MGYTHYAHLESRHFSDEEWNALCNEVIALNIHRLELTTITEDLIEVRGSCEWFVIHKNADARKTNFGWDYFVFTKTRQAEDYDHIIVACYMALYRCVRGVKLSTDGGWSELQAGREYYRDTLCLSAHDIRKAFAKTIHDARQKWFIGNPIYAWDGQDKEEWYDFLGAIPESINNDDGTGITFNWKWGQSPWVYNTKDIENIIIRHDDEEHRIELGDMFAVLPAPLFCEQSIKEIDASAGRYAIVWAAHRPVFEFDKNDFPHMTYTIDHMTGVDTQGHTACEACGEWVENNNIWFDADANNICVDCHGDEDEGEDY